MSSLPGNPYEDDARMYAIESSLRASWDEKERMILATQALAHAQMSMAYEQRTANLIASLHLQAVNHQAGVYLSDKSADMLNERLGMSDDV